MLSDVAMLCLGCGGGGWRGYLERHWVLALVVAVGGLSRGRPGLGLGLGGSRPTEGWVGEGLGGEAGGVLAGFAVGSRVAGYLLEEQVGAGGMAVVFRARDERLRRLVALKVLGPALAADEDFRRRFIGESLAAAAVEDPHIIPVHEAGEAGGVLFIAMRYVPGGDVRTLLRRTGPLPSAQAAAIISPVASALDSAHAAGLVHRDVKPANMLLDVRPGRPDHVYLSDFGLSKGALSLGLTGSGHFLGTPGYAAPEQIQGRPVDGRADQYALACTAFELLCGMAVFPRDEILAVMYAHLSEPPPLAGRRPGIPAAADDVFAQALAKEPAGRYASCQEFADALRGAFGLPPYHAALETGPQLDHPPAEITPRSAIVPGNNDPAAALTQSPDLRSSRSASGGEIAGSWPATQHQARHARAPARQEGMPGHGQAPAAMPPGPPGSKPAAALGRAGAQQGRKPAVTRRAMLGLAAAATAGLAAAGWDLSQSTTSHHAPTPRRTTAPRPSGGTPLWTTTIPNNGIAWGPAVAGEIIYIGDAGQLSGLYAFRASDGHMLWHRRGAAQGGSREADVTVNRKTIYTLTNDGHMNYGLAAYNAKTGATSWELPSFINVGPVIGPTITDGVLYLAGNYGKLYALKLTSGRPLWNFPTHGVPQGLAASGQTAYVASAPDGSSGSSDGGLYAIRSGQQAWRFTSSGVINADPKIAGNLVYFMTSNGNLYALHSGSGQVIWHSNFGAGATTASLAGGIIYVGDGIGRVRALQVADGKEIWRSSSNTWMSSLFFGSYLRTSIVADNDALYVSNEHGEVHALRASDGARVWSLKTGGSNPVLATAQNMVYVGSNNLYAIRATDGKRQWTFPIKTWSLATTPGVVYVNTGTKLYALRA